MLHVTQSISISPDDLEEIFLRSSGPGGQHVNKVSTAVQLKFDVTRSRALPEAVRKQMMALAGRRLNLRGVITITADRFRSQARNREDARVRLVELIREALIPPKTRRPTRPTRSSKQQRTDAKKRRSKVKSLRRIEFDD